MMKNNIEVEIKAKIEVLENIVERLEDLGAVYKKSVREKDLYFNHPCKDFMVTDEAVRLRENETGTYLTYKGPKLDKETKSREELEIKIQDISKFEQFLLLLGFEKVKILNKFRKIYSYQNSLIMLDTVENLGNYVEIECIGNYDFCKSEVLNIAKLLNLKDLERRSYLELFLSK